MGKVRDRVTGMSDEPPARQGAPEAGTDSAGMRHVGVIAGSGSQVMLLVGDVEVAERWRGCENGEDDSGKGSDWELCLHALFDDDAAVVAFDGGELLAFQIFTGGLVDAYRAGEALVLVEVTYTLDGRSVRADADFLGYVASPFCEPMFDAGSFVVSSGAIAILPATLPGGGAGLVLPGAGPSDVARLPPHDLTGWEDDGLAIRLPAGGYRVCVEKPVKRAWGGACRAVIAPCQDVALTEGQSAAATR
jgi:hypothetical protein